MFDLPQSGLVQILGSDAEKVVNNLCTNDVKKLAVDTGCEVFVTNVRGWCVEHGFAIKRTDEILLAGQFGNSAALCTHIDRYIVREDAKITDQSDSKCLLLLRQHEATAAAVHFKSELLAPTDSQVSATTVANVDVIAVSIELLARGDVMLIADASDRGRLVSAMGSIGIELLTGEEFERQRIASFWPLAGREILDKSIPQELDRDPRSISFTKGCYLGQETIARLDAIGQLQKKLCLVRIESVNPIEPGSALLKDGQPVGQVTSATPSTVSEGNDRLALAYLRRGNFQAGVQLSCNGVPATVLPARS